MSHTQMAHNGPGSGPNSQQPFAGMLPSIIVSAVFPIVIFRLASPHMPTMSALLVAGIPPLLYSVYGWVRARSLDIVSMIALFTLAISLLMALVVHDPHLLLIRDSYLTGAFGLLCLISLTWQRPLAFYVYRWMFVRTPEQLAAFEAGWSAAYIRRIRRLVTAIWGLAFVAETLVDMFLAYHLPTGQFVGVHPILYWGTMLVTFGGAILYTRQAHAKIEAR